MPDADDFDIDYFRGLLSGGEKKAPAAEPAAKTRPSVAPKKRATVAGASRKKSASPTRRKKA